MALFTDAEVEEVLAIDLALERLAHVDERALRVRVPEFAGLTLEETAQALGSPASRYSERGRRPWRGSEKRSAVTGGREKG